MGNSEQTLGYWISEKGLNRIVQASYAKALWIGVAPVSNGHTFRICKGVVACLLDFGPPCFSADSFAQQLVHAVVGVQLEITGQPFNVLVVAAQVCLNKRDPSRYAAMMEVLRQKALLDFSYVLRPETFQVSEVEAILDCAALEREVRLYWDVPVYDEG